MPPGYRGAALSKWQPRVRSREGVTGSCQSRISDSRHAMALADSLTRRGNCPSRSILGCIVRLKPLSVWHSDSRTNRSASMASLHSSVRGGPVPRVSPRLRQHRFAKRPILARCVVLERASQVGCVLRNQITPLTQRIREVLHYRPAPVLALWKQAAENLIWRLVAGAGREKPDRRRSASARQSMKVLAIDRSPV
jgi:hypothetical protein